MWNKIKPVLEFIADFLALASIFFIMYVLWIITPAQEGLMTDLIGFIEDLEMLDALDPVAREAHLEYLINQYKKKLADEEKEMEKQFSLVLQEKKVDHHCRRWYSQYIG